MNAKRPVTGRTVFLWVSGFFAVVIAANVVMMKLAIDTLPGTEVDSAYKASIAYNAEITAAKAQHERGWRAEAHVERDATGRASIRVALLDRAGAPLGGLALAARLSRPTDQRGDREIGLREREPGRFIGAVDDLPPGQWDLVIEADRGGERMFVSRNRIVLR